MHFSFQSLKVFFFFFISRKDTDPEISDQQTRYNFAVKENKKIKENNNAEILLGVCERRNHGHK